MSGWYPPGMLDALKNIIASKKWLAVLVGIVIAVLAQQGVISADLGHQIDLLLGIGIAGQAIADHGKSAAQIRSSAVAAVAKPEPASATSPGAV